MCLVFGGVFNSNWLRHAISFLPCRLKGSSQLEMDGSTCLPLQSLQNYAMTWRCCAWGVLLTLNAMTCSQVPCVLLLYVGVEKININGWCSQRGHSVSEDVQVQEAEAEEGVVCEQESIICMFLHCCVGEEHSCPSKKLGKGTSK